MKKVAGATKFYYFCPNVIKKKTHDTAANHIPELPA